MVHHYSRGLLALLGAILLLTLCVTVAVAADPTVTITVTKWAQPPLEPTDFTITQIGANSINITWTMGTAANITVVRGSTSGYPWMITDGSAAYSGNATYVVVDGLDLSSNTYYYRAWSQNEYGTSTGYAQASIGESATTTDVTELMTLLIGLIEGPTGITNMMFAVALMGFAFWKKGWLRVLMSVSLIVWGAFMASYDMKIAAPFIGVGILLFLMAIFQLITAARETREVQWAN
jgi:hypothetical protein